MSLHLNREANVELRLLLTHCSGLMCGKQFLLKVEYWRVSEYEAWLLSGSEEMLCCSSWRVSLSCSVIPCLARKHDCVQQNAGLRHILQIVPGRNV